jgi:hypothetical protein
MDVAEHEPGWTPVVAIIVIVMHLMPFARSVIVDVATAGPGDSDGRHIHQVPRANRNTKIRYPM